MMEWYEGLQILLYRFYKRMCLILNHNIKSGKINLFIMLVTESASIMYIVMSILNYM